MPFAILKIRWSLFFIFGEYLISLDLDAQFSSHFMFREADLLADLFKYMKILIHRHNQAKIL